MIEAHLTILAHLVYSFEEEVAGDSINPHISLSKHTHKNPHTKEEDFRHLLTQLQRSFISRRLNRWIVLIFGHSHYDIRATFFTGGIVQISFGSPSAHPSVPAAEFW